MPGVIWKDSKYITAILYSQYHDDDDNEKCYDKNDDEQSAKIGAIEVEGAPAFYWFCKLIDIFK